MRERSYDLDARDITIGRNVSQLKPDSSTRYLWKSALKIAVGCRLLLGT
jgi:hypothetical protein